MIDKTQAIMIIVSVLVFNLAIAYGIPAFLVASDRPWWALIVVWSWGFLNNYYTNSRKSRYE